MDEIKKYGFMKIALAASLLSKDRSTKVGALIIGPDLEVRSIGWNGFARKVNDNISSRHDRPEKYLWTAHAEVNAIYNAARVGTPLKDASIFSTKSPCMTCAIGIIQSGIKQIYTLEEQDPNWLQYRDKVLQMLSEANVNIEFLKDFKNE